MGVQTWALGAADRKKNPRFRNVVLEEDMLRIWKVYKSNDFVKNQMKRGHPMPEDI